MFVVARVRGDWPDSMRGSLRTGPRPTAYIFPIADIDESTMNLRAIYHEPGFAPKICDTHRRATHDYEQTGENITYGGEYRHDQTQD